jgi:hypothetical protein
LIWYPILSIIRNSYRVGKIPGFWNARGTFFVLIRSWTGADFASVSAVRSFITNRKESISAPQKIHLDN